MSILLKGGTVVTMDERRRVLFDHDVLLEDDRIRRVEPTGAIPAAGVAEEISCRGKVLIPGLISAHSHLSGIAQRGLWNEPTFESWSAKTYATDAHCNFSPEEIHVLHVAACIELLRHGVTTALDMFSAYPEGALDKVEAAGRAIVDTGMRGIIAYAFKDRSPDNPHLTVKSSGVETIIRAARSAGERLRGLGPRVGFMLAPSAPQRCGDELLRRCAELARDMGVGIHTHLAETRNHAEIGEKIYREPIVKHLERMGFLTPSLSVAHAVWLDDEEIGLLKRGDVKVIHNPASNMRLGSGVARVKDMLRSGLCLGLGCDSANAGTTYSIFEQMKLAVLLPRAVWGPEKWVSSEEAFAMATIGGARSLLLDASIGSIEEGKKADLVILRPSSPLMPLNDPIEQIALAEHGGSVRTVFVDGRAVLADGRIRTVDEDAVIAGLDSLQGRVRSARAKVSARG